MVLLVMTPPPPEDDVLIPYFLPERPRQDPLVRLFDRRPWVSLTLQAKKVWQADSVVVAGVSPSDLKGACASR